MLNQVQVVTGQTDHLIEDIPNFQEHQFIIQARQFIKNGTNPIVYYDAVRQSLPMVSGVERKTAKQLLDSVEVTLINLVADELKKSDDARKAGDTKATKPRELYSKYAPALEAIIKRGSYQPKYSQPIWTTTAMQAKQVHTDLFLSQSLSEGDLLNPEWIDPYTGDTIIEANDASEYFDKLVQHNPGINPLKAFAEMAMWDIDHTNTDTPVVNLMSGWQKEILVVADRCAKDLGWDDATKQAFIQAQMGGFDQDSDDIVLPDDNTDDYTPPTLLPNELVLNKELWWSARDAITAFNQARSKVFAWMKKKGIKPRAWHDTFRTYILRAPMFTQLIDAIATVANEDIVTGAALYLSMAGDYGLMEQDIQGIHGVQPNAAEAVRVGLLEFANAWEDDLLSLNQDAISPTSETCPHDYVDLVDTNEFSATMPKHDPNPIKTGAWNKGFIKAAMAGGTWKQAEDAGWQQWREEMDVDASKAYDEAFARSKKRNIAMSAFWKICDKHVPRPQDTIKSIARSKMGLVLQNGREINWNIVELKLRNDELDVSGDIKPRLLAKLQEFNIGKRVWDLLK
jgi:hypothetical protein